MEMAEMYEELQEIWTHINKFEDTIMNDTNKIKVVTDRLESEVNSIINLVKNLNLPETINRYMDIDDFAEGINALSEKSEELSDKLSTLEKLLEETRDSMVSLKDELKLQKGKIASLSSIMSTSIEDIQNLKGYQKKTEEKFKEIGAKIDEIKKHIIEYTNKKEEWLRNIEERLEKIEGDVDG